MSITEWVKKKAFINFLFEIYWNSDEILVTAFFHP